MVNSSLPLVMMDMLESGRPLVNWKKFVPDTTALFLRWNGTKKDRD